MSRGREQEESGEDGDCDERNWRKSGKAGKSGKLQLGMPPHVSLGRVALTLLVFHERAGTWAGHARLRREPAAQAASRVDDAILRRLPFIHPSRDD